MMDGKTKKETKEKTGEITVTKIDGTITSVKSDFHIDELFKIVHHLRTKLSDGHPDKDVLKSMENMAWPVPKNNPTRER